MKERVTFFYLSALFIFDYKFKKKGKKSCHIAFVLAHLSLMFTLTGMFKRQKNMLFLFKLIAFIECIIVFFNFFKFIFFT